MNKYAQEAFLAGILLLLPVAAVSAYAQGMPQEVSGTYTNAELGVEITFPVGWSGFEVAQTPDTTLVATSPGGLSEPDPATMKTITLLITDKGARDPSDPSSLTQNVIDCNEPSIESRTVAGVQGTQVTVECPSTDQKFRMVAVETADNIVAVMFMTPTSEFESNLGAFDSAVASLTVQGASGTGGIPTTPTDDEPTTSMQSVMVGGEAIQVSIESASTVSALALNEESKMLSYKTDGTGTETTVAVGSVLEGPYTVMVDGEATTEFEESTDAQGTKTITTSHGEGAHEVSISGTQVVPEFPLAVLGAIAAVVGVIAVLGRTRFIKV
ncbi:MAG: hypothetical protein ACRD99_02440 [Nitrososphaera sp.]